MDNHSNTEKPWQAVRTEAVESLLVELGVIDSARVDEFVRHYEEKVGPKGGARVVARAWMDPDFTARLMADGLAACAELGTPRFPKVADRPARRSWNRRLVGVRCETSVT